MYRFALALSLFAFVSCDSHTWEDGADGSKGTKRIFSGHGSHDDGHGDHDSHASDDKHKEEKAHGDDHQEKH